MRKYTNIHFASRPCFILMILAGLFHCQLSIAQADPIILSTGYMRLTIEGPEKGQYGTFRDGVHWTTINTKVLAVEPSPEVFNAAQVDGYSVNPGINATHGFDNRYDMKRKYETPPALPIMLNEVGDVFISVRSQREQNNNDGGHYVNAQAIVRLKEAPPDNAFAPPLVHWPGREKWQPVVVDVGATLDRLPVFAADGVEVPPAQAFLERIDTLNLYMIGAGATRRYYGNFFPYRFGSSSNYAAGNYGVNLT